MSTCHLLFLQEASIPNLIPVCTTCTCRIFGYQIIVSLFVLLLIRCQEQEDYRCLTSCSHFLWLSVRSNFSFEPVVALQRNQNITNDQMPQQSSRILDSLFNCDFDSVPLRSFSSFPHSLDEFAKRKYKWHSSPYSPLVHQAFCQPFL